MASKLSLKMSSKDFTIIWQWNENLLHFQKGSLGEKIPETIGEHFLKKCWIIAIVDGKRTISCEKTKALRIWNQKDYEEALEIP